MGSLSAARSDDMKTNEGECQRGSSRGFPSLQVEHHPSLRPVPVTLMLTSFRRQILSGRRDPWPVRVCARLWGLRSWTVLRMPCPAARMYSKMWQRGCAYVRTAYAQSGRPTRPGA